MEVRPAANAEIVSDANSAVARNYTGRSDPAVTSDAAADELPLKQVPHAAA
jgi:hypothetical protein